MIDINQIKQQIESQKILVSEHKKQIVIFENIIQKAVKGVPKEYRTEMMQLQNVLTKSKNLAADGKMEEVHTLINKFKDGRKDSK